MEVMNAQILDTSLGREDHGIFTFGIHIRVGTCLETILGGYALDRYVPGTGNAVREFSGKSMEAISIILDIVGVEKWEDLKGKYIRIKQEKFNSPIYEIGNLMDDSKWFNMKEFFEGA